jgi:hypothetical protein
MRAVPTDLVHGPDRTVVLEELDWRSFYLLFDVLETE